MLAVTERLGVGARDILTAERIGEFSIVERLREETEATDVAGVHSGRAALHLALNDAGLNKNDEVLLPAYACYAVRRAVSAVATPKFVDIDQDTLMMDLDAAAAAAGPDTTAILAVHHYGDRMDMEAVADVARNHDLVIIEDACQALGTMELADAIGVYSDYCSFSFNYFKDMTAYRGGVLVSKKRLPPAEEPAPARSWQVRLLGISATDRILSSLPGFVYDALRSGVLDNRARGASDHLGDTGIITFPSWVDGILAHQFSKLDSRVRARRANAGVYDDTLPSKLVLPRRHDEHAYFRYPVLFPEDRRRKICRQLRRQGIGVSPMYAYTIGPAEDNPVARDTANRMLNLPVHAGISQDEVKYIAEVVQSAVEATR